MSGNHVGFLKVQYKFREIKKRKVLLVPGNFCFFLAIQSKQSLLSMCGL